MGEQKLGLHEFEKIGVTLSESGMVQLEPTKSEK